MPDFTLCIGLTPALQEVREFQSFRLGEVNRAVSVRLSAAGKGVNTARVLRTLGGNPLLVGFAGGDTGEFIRQDLRRGRVPERLIRVKARTRVCVTLKDQATGTITELVEETRLPGRAEWQRFQSALRSFLPRARLVIIAGALMPGAPSGLYAAIARRARQHGIPLIIDSQREPLSLTLKHRSLIAKLNVHELENTLGRSFRSERAILGGARKLLEAGAENAVITHGAEGAWLVSAAGAWHFRPPRIRPVNPIGSGDAFTAGLARALLQGRGLNEAMRLGVACGAANALTLEPGVVRMPDVRRLLPRVKIHMVIRFS